MLDFAPLYSGVIMGVSNTVANFTGILAPLTTGLLLDAGNTLEQWRTAFWISAAIYVAGWVAFQVCQGRADLFFITYFIFELLWTP